MKNNRQIGLDGKIFISTSIHRGAFFVFMLMLYGIATATADILKLTGSSGVAMGAFTTTLLIYDFIASLMLVVVVFYAYFLECGADVPVLKEKPLMIFGFFRLGYYLLLSYYLCYRALYCIINRDTVSIFQGIFYIVYFCLVILLILANCYIFNIITRNLIRRSYEKSFHHLAIAGFAVQALLPVSYILARIFMDDVGDEYFTSAICDLLRLLIAPMMLTSVWFLFLHAVSQVHDVYSEVDSALKSKRYQITYTSEASNQNQNKNGQKAAVATATMLPAGASVVDAIPDKKVRALNSATIERTPAPMTAPAPVQPVTLPQTASIVNEVTSQVNSAEYSADKKTSPAAEKIHEADSAAHNSATETAASEDEIISTFAAEARKAVARTSVQNKQKKAQQTKGAASQQHQKQNQQRVHAQPVLPVQEFDPYPAASVPHRSQNQTQSAAVRQKNAQNGPARGNNGVQRSQQPGKNNYAARPQPQQQQRGTTQNANRPAQNRPHPNAQPNQNKNNQHPGQKGKQSKKR